MSRPRPALSRLARLLEVPESDLDDLGEVPDEDLATLHRQINDSLYGEGKAAYARVANLTRTIPSPVAGKLAEKFLPPVLAARVAEQLPPLKARDLVGRVSVRYLADIAIVLDPIGARPVIEQVPPERIGQVARELFSRGEYAAMSEFTRAVTEEGLLAALDQATPTELAEVLPMLEWGPTLDRVLGRLSPTKVEEIVDGLTATQLADLATTMDLTPLRPILETIEEQTVAEAARVVFDRREYDAVAGLAAALPPRLLSAAIDVAEPADLEAIVPLLEPSAELDEALARHV